MANINLRDELKRYKNQFGLLQRIPCTKEENKEYHEILKNGGVLPEGIYPYLNYLNESDNNTIPFEFYTVLDTDLTESEIEEYLTYKKLDLIKTIKNCVVFFTTLAVIGLIVWFFTMLGSM